MYVFVVSCWFLSDFLRPPWTLAHQTPLSKEFLRQGYWSGLPLHSPGDLPNPGNEPGSPALQAESLLSELPGEPNLNIKMSSEQLNQVPFWKEKNKNKNMQSNSWIDAFKLRCWRRLLRVPWTAKRSNQSILKEINPEYWLERLMLKLKLQYLGHLMQIVKSSGKDCDAGKDWRQEEKGTTEDEMVG